MNDASLLVEYLGEHLPGMSGDVTLEPFAGGQSNPTFLLRAGASRYVLRKKPPGPLLPGAHSIDREHRVMSALHRRGFPVPKMHLYCDDETILGTPFYVMEFLDGRIFMDQALPGMDRHERADIYGEMNRVIAKLHSVDVDASGLSDYGRPGNYFSRQIARWSKQCREATLPISDAMNRLMDWLPDNIPPDQATTLVHGDFRIDNLVFHPTQASVIGVLDWELSTLGHPMADFSYHCMSWHIPHALWRGIGGLDLLSLGIPDEASYVARYAEATGRQPGEHWLFYIAYNLFRMAAIMHGIGERAAKGNAVAADASEMGAKAAPLASIGWDRAQRYMADRR